jgi:hypothetical protein
MVTATNLNFRLRANAETSHSVQCDLVVVVIGIVGGGEKFSYGMVRSQKPLLSALMITATLFSYQGTCMIQYEYIVFNSIP